MVIVDGSRSLFLSTPSARRATFRGSTLGIPAQNFYPRPPRGGRRARLPEPSGAQDFYPRPPRGGRLAEYAFAKHLPEISIHALREEGDVHPDPQDHLQQISIHALREEGDRPRLAALPPHRDFYPRPPRGGRPAKKSTELAPVEFLSTPSARRATAKTETKSLFSNKLYNILHEFRRALIYNGSKSYPNHAK